MRTWGKVCVRPNSIHWSLQTSSSPPTPQVTPCSWSETSPGVTPVCLQHHSHKSHLLITRFFFFNLFFPSNGIKKNQTYWQRSFFLNGNPAADRQCSFMFMKVPLHCVNAHLQHNREFSITISSMILVVKSKQPGKWHGTEGLPQRRAYLDN